jgi:hypothetical protein
VPNFKIRNPNIEIRNNFAEYPNPKRIAKSNLDARIFDSRGRKSSLCVTEVMSLGAFREQPLAAALAPARKDGATAFGTHPGAETVLTFACSLGWLISALHKTENSSGPIGKRLQ